MQFDQRVTPPVAPPPGAYVPAERRTQQQAFVADLGQAALAGIDLDILFDRACHGLRRLLDMDRCSVYEVAPDRSALLFRYGMGWDEAVGFVRAIPLDRTTPPAVAYETGSAVVLGNDRQSHFAGGIAQKIGAVSGVSVPIGNSERNRYGVLSTHSLSERSISEEDSAFVTSVANVLAAAIDQRERQAELEALIGDSPDAVARFDRNLRRTFANRAFENDFSAAVGVDENWTGALQKSLKSRQPIRFEAHTVHGAVLEVRAVPEIVGNDVVGVLCVGRDVTDRKLNEELLANRAQKQHAVALLGRDLLRADSSEFLRQACVAVAKTLETDLVVVLAADHEAGRITVEAEHGYPAWLPGRSFDLSSSGCASWTLTHHGATVVDDVEQESRFRVHPISVEAGARSGICIAVPDADRPWGVIVTYSRATRAFGGSDVDFLSSVAHLLSAAIYRRRAEQKLERQGAELQELVDGAPDIILRNAPDTTVLYANDALKTIGSNPSDIIGTRMEHPWAAAIERVVATGARAIVELEVGHGKRLEVRLAPEFEGNNVVSVLSIGRDITERRSAEEERRKLETQLEQAKRVASIGRLGTTVAHEFNNVLMSISPFAELIARSCPDQPQIQRAAQHIRNAVVRGRRVTQEIMRFARPAEPALEMVDLSIWLPITVQGLRPSLGATDVSVRVPATRLYASIDRQQMEQVLMNLLANARDALSGKGDGRIELVLTRSEHGGGQPVARIAVHDDGCGMTAEVAANIFEPFFTTKRSGTGLGLPVVKQIIESHRGSIEVLTENGSGTTFNVHVPLVNPPAKQLDLRAPRILLVEDNETVAAGIIGLLEIYGAEAQHSSTGSEALEVIGARAPDAIILDVSLPDIDGVELFHEIRRSNPNLPVIFSTGHADQARLRKALCDGNVARLSKPYDLGELSAALSSVLAGQPHR